MKTTVHIEYHMYTWYYTTPKSSTACDFVCAVALRVRESAITACAQAVQCGHGGADRSCLRSVQRLTRRLSEAWQCARGSVPEDLAPAPTTSLLSLSVITQPARQLPEEHGKHSPAKSVPYVLSRHDRKCSGGSTGSNADQNKDFLDELCTRIQVMLTARVLTKPPTEAP